MISFIASAVVATNILLTTSIAQLDSTNAIRTYDRASDRIERMDERKEDVEERMQDRVESREEFRTRMREIRDERVQTILENITERFDIVSEKWSEHWANVLSRLEDLITKIETKAEESGVSSDELTNAIIEAKEAIRVANSEVDEFLNTEFDFDVSDEDSIGENAREIISKFKQSASDASSSVRVAKNAVHSAFEELRNLISENES